MKKKKLDYDEQIKKLEDLGISFVSKSKTEAKYILKNNNYFFKLAYYRKNFIKDTVKGYECDFHALSELAIIDMRLRYILIQMCLDIEHSIKCKLLDLITEDNSEDGYRIVQDFISDENGGDLNRIFSNYGYTDENGDFIVFKKFEKYYLNPPIWVCLEIMTFGQLSAFVEYYYKLNNDQELKLISQSMRLIKNIRNKCAHSEPIIIKLKAGKKQLPYTIKQEVNSYSFTNKQLYVKPIIDLVSLFISHKKYCSDGIVSSRSKDLVSFKSRYTRSLKHFSKSNNLERFFNALDKLIDNHYDSNII